MLKNSLDEHGLELRLRAANEAEAACEKRLYTAEAEIKELRAKLDATERFVFMHTTTDFGFAALTNWQRYSIFFPSLLVPYL